MGVFHVICAVPLVVGQLHVGVVVHEVTWADSTFTFKDGPEPTPMALPRCLPQGVGVPLTLLAVVDDLLGVLLELYLLHGEQLQVLLVHLQFLLLLFDF